MPALQSYQVDTTSPVLVTGATGYVAGELVKQLLAAGVSVEVVAVDEAALLRAMAAIMAA